jgi:hypothetical protein
MERSRRNPSKAVLLVNGSLSRPVGEAGGFANNRFRECGR